MDDLISRQAAIEAVIDLCKYYTPTKSVNHPHMDFVIEALQDLPSVNQEPKTGHWIKYGIPRCGEQHYKCTSCGYYINFGQWGELYTKEFKYCPNCGAKMVEPQKREG